MVQIIQSPIQNLQTVQQRWVSRMTPRTRNSRLAAVYTPSCCSGALADRALCGWVAPMPRDGPGRAGMPKQRPERKSAGKGKGGAGRVDSGGRRYHKKKNNKRQLV